MFWSFNANRVLFIPILNKKQRGICVFEFKLVDRIIALFLMKKGERVKIGGFQMKSVNSAFAAISRKVAAPTISVTSGIKSSFFIPKIPIVGLQAYILSFPVA